MRFWGISLATALAVVGMGCASQTAAPEGDAYTTDGKYDSASVESDGRWKAHTTNFTVWLDPTVVRETRRGKEAWVLRGRTSKNLTDVHTWIFDDAFGTAKVLSPRTFEVVVSGGQEINSMLSGLRLFLSFDATGEKESITAAVTLAATFSSPESPSRLWINETVRPIWVDGLRYRGRVRGEDLAKITATAADGTRLAVNRRAGSATTWDLDMSFSRLHAAAAGVGGEVLFEAESLTGRSYVKRATLSVVVDGFGLTRLPAEDVWGADGACDSGVQACLRDLSLTEKDTEACGNYRDVTPCNIRAALPTLGVAPDDRSALDAALNAVSASLGAHEQVAADNFYVQNTGGNPADLEQVTAAYLTLLRIESTATVVPSLTNAAVKAELGTFDGEALLPAAQKVVLQQSFKAAKVTVSSLPPWNETRLLLYFPAAGRLVVIHHATR